MELFHDARRKVKRAHTHIQDIETRIRLLHETNVSRININPQTGGEILMHDFSDSTAFDDLALLIGDAVHNLNCALDYVWLQTIEKIAPRLIDDRAKMPVRKCAEEVKGWLEKTGIQGTSRLFNFIMNTIQPHGGGNDAIWAVHNFDIRDKHRLLIPVLSHAFITNIVVVDQGGERWPGTGSSAVFQRPPYIIEFQPGLHVAEKGELAAEIIVTDDKSGCEMSVPEELTPYAHTISQTVELFAGFLETESL